MNNKEKTFKNINFLMGIIKDIKDIKNLKLFSIVNKEPLNFEILEKFIDIISRIEYKDYEPSQYDIEKAIFEKDSMSPKRSRDYNIMSRETMLDLYIQLDELYRKMEELMVELASIDEGLEFLLLTRLLIAFSGRQLSFEDLQINGIFGRHYVSERVVYYNQCEHLKSSSRSKADSFSDEYFKSYKNLLDIIFMVNYKNETPSSDETIKEFIKIKNLLYKMNENQVSELLTAVDEVVPNVSSELMRLSGLVTHNSEYFESNLKRMQSVLTSMLEMLIFDSRTKERFEDVYSIKTLDDVQLVKTSSSVSYICDNLLEDLLFGFEDCEKDFPFTFRQNSGLVSVVKSLDAYFKENENKESEEIIFGLLDVFISVIKDLTTVTTVEGLLKTLLNTVMSMYVTGEELKLSMNFNLEYDITGIFNINGNSSFSKFMTPNVVSTFLYKLFDKPKTESFIRKIKELNPFFVIVIYNISLYLVTELLTEYLDNTRDIFDPIPLRMIYYIKQLS